MPSAEQKHHKHNQSQQEAAQHLLAYEFHNYWFTEFGSML
jgi:hypothetical protein